eukprot:15674419-Heterocapsa_arctica.AAC.1
MSLEQGEPGIVQGLIDLGRRAGPTRGRGSVPNHAGWRCARFPEEPVSSTKPLGSVFLLPDPNPLLDQSSLLNTQVVNPFQLPSLQGGTANIAKSISDAN